MPHGQRTPFTAHWDLAARANGFEIPEDELRQLTEILDPLVSCCRQAFDKELFRVDPVGSFRPGKAGARHGASG